MARVHVGTSWSYGAQVSGEGTSWSYGAQVSGEGTSWSYGAQVSGEGVCGYLMELWSTGEWRGPVPHGVMEHR